MKIYEVLTLIREPLTRLNDNNINLSYLSYLEMYHEYIELLRQGEKKTYIRAVLSEKYNIGITKFKEIINKFDVEV